MPTWSRSQQTTRSQGSATLTNARGVPNSSFQVRPSTGLQLATILPEKLPPRCTPQSLPLRERVWLAQRIALARFLGVKWADVAMLEGMSERTLRYHLARWKTELEQEQQPTSALLVACQARMEADQAPQLAGKQVARNWD